MKQVYIVKDTKTIYGVYDNDKQAKECQEYVRLNENINAEIRHLILNKNYWDIPESQKYSELYNVD